MASPRPRDIQVSTIAVERSEHQRCERYRLATEAGSVAVWDWDLTTDRLYIDPVLKLMLGYREHEIGEHLDDWIRLMHADDGGMVLERAREHLRRRTPFFEVEHRMLHRDKTIQWMLTRGSAVWDEGEPARIVGTTTDITERKASEHALHQTQAELARVSRFAALGEFAASIAHEVRQPLTAITLNAKTCLRWLENDSPDMAEVRAALRDLVQASRQANEVIQHNRELFSHHQVQKRPLDINAVIREVLQQTRGRLESSQIWLGAVLPEGMPMVEGDRLELQQVLLNLIANSIDAMEQVEPDARCIRVIASLESGGVVQIAVSDNGVGLEGVDVERMFHSSYTTKANGTGIGLSLSRSIVEAHGGRLWARQNRDRGATFYFTVPVSSALAVA